MSEKNQLAEDRTDWAEARTVLANERTFAGWMRTGMAAVALALGLRALFGPFEPTWVPKSVSSIFILVAILIFWSAWRKCSLTRTHMEDHDTNSQSSRAMAWVTGVLSVATIATGGILWLL